MSAAVKTGAARLKALRTLSERIADPDSRRRFTALWLEADELAQTVSAMRSEMWTIYHSNVDDGREFA